MYKSVKIELQSLIVLKKEEKFKKMHLIKDTNKSRISPSRSTTVHNPACGIVFQCVEAIKDTKKEQNKLKKLPLV